MTWCNAKREVDFFRQFLHSMALATHNAYYGARIDSALSIYDIGDLDLSNMSEDSLDLIHKSLEDIVSYLIGTTPGRVFVVGGSNDCSVPNARAVQAAAKYQSRMFTPEVEATRGP